jgi:hypothetical protein
VTISSGHILMSLDAFGTMVLSVVGSWTPDFATGTSIDIKASFANWTATIG